MNLLTETTGLEYEITPSSLPLGIFGKSEYEVLRDKGHLTLIYPSSLNNKWKFRMANYADEPLSRLDIGFTQEGSGTQLVGIRGSFVDRKFVDAFVKCMTDVYSGSWQSMSVWSLGPTRRGSLPIFLVGENLTMCIAPKMADKHFEPTGKYQFPSP